MTQAILPVTVGDSSSSQIEVDLTDAVDLSDGLDEREKKSIGSALHAAMSREAHTRNANISSHDDAVVLVKEEDRTTKLPWRTFAAQLLGQRSVNETKAAAFEEVAKGAADIHEVYLNILKKGDGVGLVRREQVESWYNGQDLPIDIHLATEDELEKICRELQRYGPPIEKFLRKLHEYLKEANEDHTDINRVEKKGGERVIVKGDHGSETELTVDEVTYFSVQKLKWQGAGEAKRALEAIAVYQTIVSHSRNQAESKVRVDK